MREYAAGLAKSRESNWLVNRLISQDARFRVVAYLLYLDADRELWPDGANYSALHHLCTHRKEVGPRVLKTMLAVMGLAGLIRTERGADRRLKFYRPTPRMADFIRQWLGYVTRALDMVQPQARRAQRLQDDPAFTRHFLVSGGRDHTANRTPADRMPDFIAFFGVREGASVLVVLLVLAAMNRTPAPSRAAIARRYGLSKAQVSNIVAEGTQRGYFLLDGAGVAVATPLLHVEFRRWIAIELAFCAGHMP